MRENKYCLITMQVRSFSGVSLVEHLQACFLGRSEHRAAAFAREQMLPATSCEYNAFALRKDKRNTHA